MRIRPPVSSVSLATCLAVVACAWPATPPPASAPASERPTPGWVEGTVVDAQGRPVAGALVNVLNTDEVPEKAIEAAARRTRTSSTGRFRVRQAVGGYLVQICKPDPEVTTSCRETVGGVDYVITYVGGSGTTDSWLRQRSLLPATSASRSLGTVAVRAGGRIVGRIDGAPDQLVAVMRLNDTVAFRTVTDARGAYTFAGLVPGRYYVAAGGEGTLPWRSGVVTVVAGHDVVVDGRLRRGATVTGRLLSGGRPVPGTDVLLSRTGHGLVAAATTDRTGRFRASGLRAGHYRVGISYDGSDYLRRTVEVDVRRDARVTTVVRVVRGASLTVRATEDGSPTSNTADELRDSSGRPVQLFRNDGSGTITYTGLRPGRYTVVVAGRHGWASRSVQVDDDTSRDLGELALDRRFLTLRGHSAPYAVVEATTGSTCPPGAPPRVGAFHEIEATGADGAYVLRHLVPGRYMLGADAWPHDHAPRCWAGVSIQHDRVRDLPLVTGASVRGRLLYDGTSAPVITPLSFELSFVRSSTGDPTEEHPARSRTVGATGRFRIGGLRAGAADGNMAEQTSEGVNDPRFQVVFPYQDGTPYWLDLPSTPVSLTAGSQQLLGDLGVVLHGTASDVSPTKGSGVPGLRDEVVVRLQP